jgi:hypothetical protein
MFFPILAHISCEKQKFRPQLEEAMQHNVTAEGVSGPVGTLSVVPVQPSSKPKETKEFRDSHICQTEYKDDGHGHGTVSLTQPCLLLI